MTGRCGVNHFYLCFEKIRRTEIGRGKILGSRLIIVNYSEETQ